MARRVASGGRSAEPGAAAAAPTPAAEPAAAPDALAELAEADAPPAIAAIFAELRQLSGVPMVALIFRHLATRPGALEDTWRSLRPAFETGRIQSTAWWLAESAPSEGLMPRIAPVAGAAIGIDDDALSRIRLTLDAYNRANPVNMLAMLCLMERLRLGASPARPLEPHGPPWSAPQPVAGPLPAMTPVAAIPPSLRRLINDLGFGDRTSPDSVVPSLYRHLTPWPALLGLVHVSLAPAFRNGSLAFAVETLHAEMRAKAGEIARSLAPLAAGEALRSALPTLSRFSSSVIPQMILIGFALKHAIAD